MQDHISSPESQIIPMDRLPIRLGQLLKFVGAVDNGLEAKHRIQNGDVRVNDQVEVRRGRQILQGDRILIDNKLFLITSGN